MRAFPTQWPRFFSYWTALIVHGVMFLPFFSHGCKASEQKCCEYPLTSQIVFSLYYLGQGLEGICSILCCRKMGVGAKDHGCRHG